MSVRILSRTTGGASADGPSRTLFCWLISAFLLTLLPHVAQLPAWLTVSILAATIVRCIAEWRRWPLPTTTSTGVVALCLLSAIFLQYHTVLGRDAGTPFMAGLLTISSLNELAKLLTPQGVAPDFAFCACSDAVRKRNATMQPRG